MVNMIWTWAREEIKKKYQEQIAMAAFLAIEFHELVHLKIHEWGLEGQPCRWSSGCDKGECFWCNHTWDVMVPFFIKKVIE